MWNTVYICTYVCVTCDSTSRCVCRRESECVLWPPISPFYEQHFGPCVGVCVCGERAWGGIPGRSYHWDVGYHSSNSSSFLQDQTALCLFNQSHNIFHTSVYFSLFYIIAILLPFLYTLSRFFFAQRIHILPATFSSRHFHPSLSLHGYISQYKPPLLYHFLLPAPSHSSTTSCDRWKTRFLL